MINLCLCELWRAYGVEPTVAVGHSVGELAAAYASGIYTVEQVLELAMDLGTIGATKKGSMLHTTVDTCNDLSVFEPLALAAVNYRTEKETSVTLCGEEAAVNHWLETDAKATKLKPEHPWHHPSYAAHGLRAPHGRHPDDGESCRFVSATKPGVDSISGPEHWEAWLREPVAFADALEGVPRGAVVLELGPHPVLSESVEHHLKPRVKACSMRRGENSISFALEQRRQLAKVHNGVQQKVVTTAAAAVDRSVDWSIPLGAQGFKSLEFARLARELSKVLYPGLEAHDFYRFQSLQELDACYMAAAKSPMETSSLAAHGALVWAILGVGLVLPGGVDSLEHLRLALCKSHPLPPYGIDECVLRREAAPLFPTEAEAEAADAQHALALVLARRAFEDAGGLDALADVDNTRIGVYLGAWQHTPLIPTKETPGAYDALGEATGALPGRVAAFIDARGPAVLFNTACSSALTALDASLGDLRRGRIDAALIGGLNALGAGPDRDRLEAQLAKARFLSPSGRCHTFSALADGYARSEGGAMFVVRSAQTISCRALILGSALTQNRRQRPLSAVDGLAQERCIRLACADAGIEPSQLDVVECHGTGTPLGDSVEINALACAGVRGKLAATKATFGHLESGAGALGLAAAVLYANARLLMRPCVSGGSVNPSLRSIAERTGIGLPDESEVTEVQLPEIARIGVSSFGFAGSNGHAIVASPPAHIARHIELKNTATAAGAHRPVAEPAPCAVVKTEDDVLAAIWQLVARVGVEKSSEDADLFELGVDSLGLAELVASIDEMFGDDIVTVDSVFAAPTVRAIAARLQSRKSGQSTALKTAPQNIATIEKVDLPEKQHAVVVSNRSHEQVRKSSFKCERPWFEVTHVGSLPRENNDSSIESVVRRQLACGVDVVNDGEWSRPNYVADLIERIEGLGEPGVAPFGRKWSDCSCCEMPLAVDMLAAPLHARRFDGSNGLISLSSSRPARANVACIAEPTYLGVGTLRTDLAALKAAAGDQACFWSCPSPGTLATFCEDRYFAKSPKVFDAEAHRAYVMALARAVKPEYEEIAGAGVTLSVDCPDLAMGRHTKWAELDEAAFVNDVVRANVDALNVALENVDNARVHICWGNYSGPHTADVGAEIIWRSILELKATTISIEAANSRHEHEWERLLEMAPLPENKRIAPGVIDTKSSVVEHPEAVARRLLRFSRTLGPARIVASTDCGFASTARSTAVTADIAWLKLESLGRGAHMARRRLYDLNNPSPRAAYGPVLHAVGFHALVIGDAPNLDELEHACAPWAVFRASNLNEALDKARRAVLDWPLAIVAKTPAATSVAREVFEELQRVPHAKRQARLFVDGNGTSMEAIKAAMLGPQRLNKLTMLGAGAEPPKRPPPQVDVVIVGAGLCGLVAALACVERGMSVAVLERRLVAGGVWTSFANSTSQVNSSEGGYNARSLVSRVYESRGGALGANRDHSPTYEILDDIRVLVDRLGPERLFRGVEVVKILPHDGCHSMVVSRVVDPFDPRSCVDSALTLAARGVVVAINDRVGVPRPMTVPGINAFLAGGGIVARGLGDDLAGIDWRGKQCVIVGFGAFAVENARTALERGANRVTVLARRHGTVCPKIIDYLNFVKPGLLEKDPATNVKQMRQWQKLYAASGATQPECWPRQIKHQGHTISVSDIWFVAHHMGKLETRVPASVASYELGGVRLDDGSFIACDIVISCIGFQRNATLCADLTGAATVKETNFIAPAVMYLADAEIDEGAFNFFFGSSVLEYAKFYSEVFALAIGDESLEGLPDALWGHNIPKYPLDERKWSHYIAAARRLISTFDEVHAIAVSQVTKRTQHFWGSRPPKAWVQANKEEWHNIHKALNDNRDVPLENQLPYFFEERDVLDWCGPNPLAK